MLDYFFSISACERRDEVETLRARSCYSLSRISLQCGGHSCSYLLIVGAQSTLPLLLSFLFMFYFPIVM